MTPSSDGISLRMLRLFDIVYRTRNVSLAAEELQTSQPSVSVSLGRLREHFNDPLFVRVGSSMEPTSRAEELIEGIRSMLAIAKDHFVDRAPFDPATSDRHFTLHMTDPAESILMPQLVRLVTHSASGVRLRVRRIDEDTGSMLAHGQVDLIVGYLGREADDLFQSKLHDEHYVCIARVDHPRVGQTLSLDQFRSEAHIVTAIAGTGHRQAERGFGEMAGGRKIALEVSSYFAVGATVAQTDLIAIVPSRLGARLAARGGVKVHDLPLKSPTFVVRQYWHRRYHDDAGNRWLRNLLSALVKMPKR
jgi:DNA-binding transcriptional LysR family regulator